MVKVKGYVSMVIGNMIVVQLEKCDVDGVDVVKVRECSDERLVGISGKRVELKFNENDIENKKNMRIDGVIVHASNCFVRSI